MELSGYLTKNHAGRALDAGSRRRYFVSEGYHVQYFETEKRKTRHGRFDLRNVTAVRGGASSTPIPHEAKGQLGAELTTLELDISVNGDGKTQKTLIVSFDGVDAAEAAAWRRCWCSAVDPAALEPSTLLKALRDPALAAKFDADHASQAPLAMSRRNSTKLLRRTSSGTLVAPALRSGRCPPPTRPAPAANGATAGEEALPDFLEATLFDKERAVIQRGYYVDAPLPGVRYNRINDFWKPFFFRHVETFVGGASPVEEVVPLEHFLHRFTRSIFWELEDMIPFANHPVYRCLWGWLGAPEVSLLKLFQGPVIRKASVYAHVVQESIMPMRHLPEGIAKFDEWFAAYPLLVFPVRIFNRGELSGFLTPHPDECDADGASGLWVDLGAYGVPEVVKNGKVWDAKASVRAMEHWTRDVGGFQALYTDIFCTPSELREMFNFGLLDRCLLTVDLGLRGRDDDHSGDPAARGAVQEGADVAKAVGQDQLLRGARLPARF